MRWLRGRFARESCWLPVLRRLLPVSRQRLRFRRVAAGLREEGRPGMNTAGRASAGGALAVAQAGLALVLGEAAATMVEYGRRC
jgi:hypothetical protein